MVNKAPTKPAVLFVCLGNICRSPMAEGALREAAREAGLDLVIDSAGTADYHLGEAPDPRAIATAARHGADISGAKGRQLCAQDFDRFTHIFALDKANMAGIEARAPRHHCARLALLLDALPDRTGEAVADPYYGDDAGFETCWLEIAEAAKAIAARLARDGADARF